MSREGLAEQSSTLLVAARPGQGSYPGHPAGRSVRRDAPDLESGQLCDLFRLKAGQDLGPDTGAVVKIGFAQEGERVSVSGFLAQGVGKLLLRPVARGRWPAVARARARSS